MKDNYKDSINNKAISKNNKTDDTFNGIPESDKLETSNVEKKKKIQEDIIKELDHKKNKISSNENKFTTNQQALEKKNSGFFVIQLASVPEVILIDKEWNRLTRIYKDLLNKKYNYKKINLKNGKTFYRLLVGEFTSKDEASEFCKLSLKRDTCIIRYYE